MSSSDEQLAKKQLAKWLATKPAPKLRASFASDGITLFAFGTPSLRGGELYLVDESSGKHSLTLLMASAKLIRKIEPLLDAPDEHKFRMDFFAAVEFSLPHGTLGLFEIG
jgi:hypothetical protein